MEQREMSYGSKLLLTKLVAYFANLYLDLPYEMTELQLNSEEECQIFDLSKSNKVLLRYIDYSEHEKFSVKSSVISKLVNRSIKFKKSYEYARSLKQELLDIIAKFNEHSIDTIFIKSLNTLPLDSDNFDILVKEKDLAAAKRVLKDSGFVELVWVKEQYKWLFRYAQKEKDYLAVHLHTAVAWDGMKFVDLDDMWKKYEKIRIDGVLVGFPSKEIHLMITLAHAFFENNKLRLNDLIYIIEDIHPKRLDWDYVIRQTINDCWFEPFHGMLLLADYVHKTLYGNPLLSEMEHEKLRGVMQTRKSNSDHLAEKLVKRFDDKMSLPTRIPIITVASYYVRKIVTKPHTPFLEKIGTVLSLSRIFLERRMPFRRNIPAFPICFVGQDGTGKTIHARHISKKLEQRGINVKYVWSRGTGFFLGPLLNLLRPVFLDGEMMKKHKKRNRKRDITLLGKEPIRSLWAYTLLADHLAKSIKVKLALALGNMVICDRYIFDTFVDVKCDLGKNFNRALERTVERMIPKPEIIFVMDAEPKELVKRRPSMRLDSVERKRSAYFEYLQTKDGVEIIDTCDELQRNREKILSNILQAFYGFYR